MVPILGSVSIFPSHLSSSQVTQMLITTCSSAAVFGSAVNPIGLANLDWKYLLVYVAWLCVEVIFIYFLFPETYGKTLEELTFLFESEKQDREALAAATAKILQDPTTAEAREPPEKKA